MAAKSERVREVRRYWTLDAMRGVAAVMVVVYHYSAYLGVNGVPHAYLAVDFFFVLSGFVIAHAYEANLIQGMSFTKFVWRRIVRLWPLYAAAMVVAFAVLALRSAGQGGEGIGRAALKLGLELFFLPVPSRGAGNDLYPLNFPAWSLGFEIIANVVYALTVRWLSLTKLMIFVAIAGGALVFTALELGNLSAGGSTWATVWAGFPRVAFGFPLGVLLYRMRSERVMVSNAAVALALVALGLALAIGQPNAVTDLAVVMVCAPVLIAFAAHVEPQGFLLKICIWMGAVSYAVYVLHIPLIEGMWTIATHAASAGVALPVLIGALATAAVAFATAADAIDVKVRRRLTAARAIG